MRLAEPSRHSAPDAPFVINGAPRQDHLDDRELQTRYSVLADRAFENKIQTIASTVICTSSNKAIVTGLACAGVERENPRRVSQNRNLRIGASRQRGPTRPRGPLCFEGKTGNGVSEAVREADLRQTGRQDGQRLQERR